MKRRQIRAAAVRPSLRTSSKSTSPRALCWLCSDATTKVSLCVWRRHSQEVIHSLKSPCSISVCLHRSQGRLTGSPSIDIIVPEVGGMHTVDSVTLRPAAAFDFPSVLTNQRN